MRPDHAPTPLEAGTPNAVSRMLSLLGDEWGLLIVQQALLGATRYAEFQARLPISNAVLTGRLRTLTEGGLFERRIYQSNPVRTDYVLTARGRSLWPMMVSIWHWERCWGPEHGSTLPVMVHTACGDSCAPTLVCAACARPTTERDVRVLWGPSGSWPRSVPTSVNRRRPDTETHPSLFPQTMSVFGNRWSAAILIAAFLGATRFGDFHDRLGAPPGSISARLRELCANGVLTDTDGYLLTDKGRAFFPILVTALDWAQRWYVAPEGDAVILTHRACERRFTAVLACDRCSAPLRGAEIGVSAT